MNNSIFIEEIESICNDNFTNFDYDIIDFMNDLDFSDYIETKENETEETKEIKSFNLDSFMDDFISYFTDRINENEIIYYANAMEYLSKYDNSLIESINIAVEYGYELQNINSELLATLLCQKNDLEELNEIVDIIKDKIQDLMNLNDIN